MITPTAVSKTDKVKSLYVDKPPTTISVLSLLSISIPPSLSVSIVMEENKLTLKKNKLNPHKSQH
jgi:hypothetical protein